MNHDASPYASNLFAGKYIIGSFKCSTQAGHVYDAFNITTRINVNMKFGHLLEPNNHEKEWRTLCALEKFRHDPQNEAIENPLVNEVIYDVVCGKLYQAIVFPHSAVNLETLLAISKMEATGKLPVDFAIRVFIQMLEGCAFLNKNLESVHGLIQPSSVEFCNLSVVPNPEGGRLPATPRIVLTDLCNVEKYGFRDKDLQAYSLNYKSTEAALGLKLAKSSDVWACGCVLFEMIFGERLFNSSVPLDLLNTIEKMIGLIPQRMKRNHMEAYGARNLRSMTDKHLSLKNVYDVSKIRSIENHFQLPEQKMLLRILRKTLQTDPYVRPEPSSMLALTVDERRKCKKEEDLAMNGNTSTQ
ncbi:hypothetical protein PRIPAC_95761 [Pristionchus pacificus]|uniref:Protein kinase domain-containing protein n=1 Tax=Pristionchus pacificus TaxID=54126 RepID=A0A2A6BC10_PRIPA|nr:hypothetical protein PRIPAC_95761 [Pristionchus pacificus]|eukprot:PDM63425.1 protein kinase [Pristionchus pacificus]